RRDHRLLIVRVGLLVDECVDEPARRLDGQEGGADVKYVPCRRLHREPVVGSVYRIELEALDGEPGWAPPVAQFLGVGDRSGDALRRREENLSRWTPWCVSAMSSIMTAFRHVDDETDGFGSLSRRRSASGRRDRGARSRSSAPERRAARGVRP